MNDLAGRPAGTADVHRLDARLTRLFARPGARTVSPFRPLVYVGLETVRPGDLYEWRGRRRGDESAGTRALFQYTLEGWGDFTRGGTRPARVGPGMAFTAILPSSHVYRLPPTSPGWRFFWVLIHHPYVVRRLAEGGGRRGGSVWAVPAGRALAGRAAALWAAVCAGTPEDEWAQEALLFDFLLAHERHGRALAHPAGPRERLLAEARALAGEDGALTARVEVLAGRHRMSRSHFSHHFRAVTGQTPAAVLRAERLAAAARRLETSRDKLASIAQGAGFADATGFCRVFRQHFHVSPAEFRRQAQGY